MNTNMYYSNAPSLGSIGDFATVALLPNSAGAVAPYVGVTSLAQWDQATVLGVPYTCYSPTAGSAVWFKTPAPKNPFGKLTIQTVSAAGPTTILPDTDLVLVTYAGGASTLVLPTVVAGAPPGHEVRVQKANTSANGIVMTPDSGASINAAAADATQALVGLNNTASTTVSAAATNDICASFIRTGLLTWRSAP
jgi:hypothetical protein